MDLADSPVTVITLAALPDENVRQLLTAELAKVTNKDLMEDPVFGGIVLWAEKHQSCLTFSSGIYIFHLMLSGQHARRLCQSHGYK
jgi:hypothetical protein